MPSKKKTYRKKKKKYVFIEGDKLTGAHTNLKLLKKWANETERKKHINVTIAEEIER